MLELHCAALLLDMDGVLVDSRAVVERVWRRWSERKGLDPHAVLAIAHGRRTEDTLRTLSSDLDVPSEVRWLEAAELGDRCGIRAVAGAVELVSSLAAGRWAVVTSAPRELAVRRLGWAGLPLPACLIPADEIGEGKPSPEGYLRAAAALGAHAAACVVIEDSPAGVAAGQAAGMRVVALTTTHGAHAFPKVAVVLPDLSRVGVRFAGGAMKLEIER